MLTSNVNSIKERFVRGFSPLMHIMTGTSIAAKHGIVCGLSKSLGESGVCVSLGIKGLKNRENDYETLKPSLLTWQR